MTELIAEAGISHGGVLKTACTLADIALTAGAETVKYQTYVPAKLLRRRAPDRPLLEKLALSFKDTIKLSKHCNDIGIEFMSTPGDLDSLKFLVEECGVQRVKIGSDDLTYKPLVEAAFATGKPVILSTGMATLSEIRQAVGDKTEFKRLTLLHCVSLYPCPAVMANVRAITTLQDEFCCAVGFSDHTHLFIAAHLAMALGATVIEKHFCPDDYNGPDAEVSLTPVQLKAFVQSIQHCEMILGSGIKEPSEQEAAMIPLLRKGKDGLRGLG